MNSNEKKNCHKNQIERLLSNAFPGAQIRKDALGLRQDGTEPSAPLLKVENEEAEISFSFNSAPYSCRDPVVSKEFSTLAFSLCLVLPALSLGVISHSASPWGSTNSCARTRPICLLCEGEKGAFSLLSSCLLLDCPILTRIPGFSRSPDVSPEPSPSLPHFASDISSSMPVG